MKKGKLALALISLFGVFGIGLTALSSCGGKKAPESSVAKYAVTWVIADHVTVNMEDGSTRPSEVEENTSLVFSLSLDTGYEVSAVRANSKRVSAKNGKYTVVVTKDTEIVIEAGESITDLRVTHNPDKLRYVAGDELDVTGMVVEASYGTGRTEAIPYGEGGYTVYPTTFNGGETNFEVTYGGKTVYVDLESTVEFLVTIDPNGGTIDAAYIAGLEALELHNYNVDAAGVITFTYYNNLKKGISLPTIDQISKTNCSFTGWSYTSTITNATNANVVARAGWQVELVELETVDLAVEEGVPYLIVTGKFKASEEVLLRLYEGNKQIELLGDTYTGTSGSDFAVKFDLTKLKDAGAEYEGAWMDIRFDAVYEGKTESMEIYVNGTNKVQVDTSKKIKVGTYTYLFATYEERLKVYFQQSGFEFLLEHVVEEGVDYLKFNGQCEASKYAGKYVEITWWQSSETEGFGSMIDSEGRFVIKYDLRVLAVALKTNSYAHIGIYEDAEKSATLYGGTNQNVLIADITNEFPQLEEKVGDIHHAFSFEGVDGLTYYVGYAWEGLMLYVVDESHLVAPNEAKIVEKDNKVYYVLTGKVKGYTEETFLYSFYFQHNDNVDHLGWDEVYNDLEVTKHAVIDAEGNFEISCCVSDIFPTLYGDSTDSWVLTSKYHFLDESEANLIEIKPKTASEETIIKDGLEYGIMMDSSATWGIASLTIDRVA